MNYSTRYLFPSSCMLVFFWHTAKSTKLLNSLLVATNSGDNTILSENNTAWKKAFCKHTYKRGTQLIGIFFFDGQHLKGIQLNNCTWIILIKFIAKKGLCWNVTKACISQSYQSSMIYVPFHFKGHNCSPCLKKHTLNPPPKKRVLQPLTLRH